MKTLKTTLLAAAAAFGLAGAETAHADALSSPSMTPPLASNANPIAIDAGGLGKFYVSGQISGLAMFTDTPISGDHKNITDLSNAQVELQKTDGIVQFYVQAGAYSLPSLDTPYIRSGTIAKNTYDAVPVAYLKIVPNSSFNIMIGKLPTLIGAEYTFTFQNMNIARGLLWNQEPAVSRGVQLNYTKGPWSLSGSINDGYYSDKYSTGSALIAYTVNPKDTVAFAAQGNFNHQSTSSFVTPIAQNNGQIYNLMWTHTEASWMVEPYLQYSRVPKITSYGIPNEVSTTGVAVLGKYSFTSQFSVAGRAEYISTSGSNVSLLNGPGSKAYSFTITPTYQYKIYFIRGEASYTKLDSAAPGAGFGLLGNKDSQARLIVETGVLF